MKITLIVVVIAVVAAMGYWLVQDAAEPEPLPTSEPVAVPEDTTPMDPMPGAPAGDTAAEPFVDDPATAEPDDVIGQSQDEADAAAEAAEDAIADILQQQEEAAAEAEEAARRAIEEAMATSDDAAAEAEAAVSEAERSIREQLEATETETETETETAAGATQSPGTADPSAVAADAEEIFTPEGFEFNRAMEVVEQADLDPINRSAARALLESVRNNPQALDAALIQLRDMLGL